MSLAIRDESYLGIGILVQCLKNVALVFDMQLSMVRLDIWTRLGEDISVESQNAMMNVNNIKLRQFSKHA
jgi:hypothetical protein